MADYPLPGRQAPGIGLVVDWDVECVTRRQRALELLAEADKLTSTAAIQIAIAGAQVQATLAQAAAVMAARQ